MAIGIRRFVRSLVERTGYTFVPLPREGWSGFYDQDGLRTIHAHEFMKEPDFTAAYSRGVQAGNYDPLWHWRVHMGLWAGMTASQLPGDFVECGVNYGFLSSAIMQLLDWDKLGKTFYLMDTFDGPDEKYITEQEKGKGLMDFHKRRRNAGFYASSVEPVRKNFSQWQNLKFVIGSIPDTLPQVSASKICYLHIDMNCAEPEVAALDHFWDRLVTGAIVLLDDYGHPGHEAQKQAMDRCATSHGAKFASLPTGQGLLVRTSQ